MIIQEVYMIKGVWIWPNRVYETGADRIISVLNRAGFTDIYFLTKGLSGKTSHLGRIAPNAFDRDLLKELISSAHKCGIRVHAWFTSASDEFYKETHPESGRMHFTRGRDRGLISFKNKEYLSYLKSIIDEVVSSYDVDGIHLDYIRYNHMLYGWDEDDLRGYEENGADISELKAFIQGAFLNDPPFNILEAYKSGNRTLRAFASSREKDVTNFAKACIEGLRRIKPSLILSAAVMPEGAYADSSFADLHYGQNYKVLSAMFDYLCPMAYTKAYDKTEIWISEIAEWLKFNSIPYVMGLQAYDHVSGKRISRDIQKVDENALGLALFRDGEFAYLFCNNGIDVINETPYTITSVRLYKDGNEDLCSVTVYPGDTAHISVTYIPDEISLSSNDLEICSYFVR